MSPPRKTAIEATEAAAASIPVFVDREATHREGVAMAGVLDTATEELAAGKTVADVFAKVFAEAAKLGLLAAL